MSIRHDWFQSDDKVVITVMLKNAVEKNYKCSIEENLVSLSADNYELILELSEKVIPDKSSHKATAFKVEITLIKSEFKRWERLEKPKPTKEEEEAKANALIKKKKPEDWDRLAKDVEKEKDDEDVNSLFKMIYENGTEEQRKAMNKSFSESGGTVLSTNWNEVAKGKTEVKPPDGCEFRQWD
jgi:suppressor of G2 allele of SKP1